MKKILIISFCLFSFSAVLFAQDKPKSFQWDKATMAEVGISKEKQKKIEGINDTLSAQLEQLKNDKSIGKEEIKEKSSQLRKDSQKKIMAELTEEEKQKVKEIKERIKLANN
jgi:predicted transglutaminase-like cysteine proteinase